MQQATDKPKKKTKPITAAGKKALRDYFVRMNWPLNRKLPRGENYRSGELGTIAAKHELGRAQVARQLCNYKNERYDNSQIKILLEADELAEKLREGLSMTSIDFVTTCMDRIINEEGAIASSADSANFATFINDFGPEATILVKRLLVSPEDPLCQLLSGLIDDWVVLAAEKFPKTAAGLPDAEVEYQRSRLAKKNVFAIEWMKHHTSLRAEQNIEWKSFHDLSNFLYNFIYLDWIHSAIDNKRPPVSYPEECLVGSMPVQ